MVQKEKHRILGVDPGTNQLGYAVIETQSNKIKLIDIGVVKMGHFSKQSEKLKKIFESLHTIISNNKPKELAIEAPFYGKNVQSMLKLGRAQGVAMAAGMTKNLVVEEYAPKKIKQSVTGNGNASKEQVAAMLENIVSRKLTDLGLDATDALAVAVCHHFQTTGALSKIGGKGNWKSFLTDNPERVWKP